MDVPFPCEMEDERWWDEDLVLDFSTMWDGIPPCVTIVGGADDGGKGTNVCKLRDLMLSRRRFLRRQGVLPFNGGLEKGKEPRQVIQMHQRPSQMVMESASLSVIHQGKCATGRKERAKIEPRNYQKNKGKETSQNKKQKAQQRKGQKERNQNQETKRKPTQHRKPRRNTTPHRVMQAEPLFCTAMGSSDAELRVGLKLSGVPPWETQLGSTNELTGSNLVEHERLGTLP